MPIIIDSQSPHDVLVIDTSTPSPRSDSEPTTSQRDLAGITAQLSRRLAPDVTGSFMQGKTRMRDEVMNLLACSALRAEEIVDTLVARGHANFRRPPKPVGDPRVGTWTLRRNGLRS